MDIKENVYECVDWIQLSQHIDHCPDLVVMVNEFRRIRQREK
jgi:hypothetical protein